MELIRVCISNLWALQERRYAVVYVAVTKFVRAMLRLLLLTTPRYFWHHRQQLQRRGSSYPSRFGAHGVTPVARLNGSLRFVDGKSVVLVSHELSLSGGPLLLMELGSILRRNGAHVVWVTANKKKPESDPVVAFLETKLLNHGLQIMAARGARTEAAVTASDLVILNTAVSGKWMDAMLRELGEVKSSEVLAKTLWWIHEMRGHYFAMEYVRHLPQVAGVMIDSHAAADYWRTRTRERLRFA